MCSGMAARIREFLAGNVEIPAELRQGMQALAEGSSQSLFQASVDLAPIAISITDLNANILYANGAFSEITGYELEEVLGRNESLLSDNSTPKSAYEGLWATIQRKEVWRGILVNRRKDGTRYLAEITIKPVVGPDGRVTNYLGMHRDVTEMHRLHWSLQNQKALLESLIDTAPVAIVLLDSGGRVYLDNQEYKKLVGDLSTSEPVSLLSKALDAAEQVSGEARGVLEAEVACTDLQGRERWFSCSRVRIDQRAAEVESYFTSTPGTYTLLLAKEITAEHRHRELARQSALEALLAEEELVNGMREALLGAAHTFQVPLNLLAAALNLTRSQGGDSALQGVLREAHEAGETALNLLQGSIPIATPEPHVPVNLNEILRDALTVCTERLLACGVTVEWRPANILPMVLGRPSGLRNLFKQLITNAIDAMSVRGWKRRDLLLRSRLLEDGIELVVQDSGPGIPEADRLRVFEPLYSTKGGAGRRAGTGLAIAREVVNQHDGTIDIDPSWARGCRFIIVLPLNRQLPADDEEHYRP